MFLQRTESSEWPQAPLVSAPKGELKYPRHPRADSAASEWLVATAGVPPDLPFRATHGDGQFRSLH